MKKSFLKAFIFFTTLLALILSATSASAAGSWQTVGSAGFSESMVIGTSLALDSNNVPYVAYQDFANSDKATVMKFEGGSWQTVGSAGFSAGSVDIDISLALDSNNIPYVAYADFADPAKKATVMKFDNVSGSWQTVGSAGFSAGRAYTPSLALDSNDVPYVAYTDDGNLSKATVMKFDSVSGTWQTVGSAGFSEDWTYYTSLALDSNDVPYVVYKDGAYSGGAATVMRFDSVSGTWQTVGSAGFSAGSADYTSLALDSNNVPYVAYRDGGNSVKATVMVFDSVSGSWQTVGSAGFSAGSVDFTSLALDSNNVPYVAYRDWGNSKKATVMKFDSVSGSWQAVGSAGFSAGKAVSTSIALDSNNVPYVAYQDEAKGYKATVMKFGTGTTSGPTDIDVTIAGTSRGTYHLSPGNSQPLQYTLDGGPVVISSNNGVGIIASLNQWRRPTPYGGWTGVAQSMALPLEQISSSYVIPRYNGTDPTLYNAVLMANVDNVPRTITVKIGGTTMGSYLLGPSDSRFEVYNVTGGPLVVSSDVGSKIVASLYELKRAGDSGEYNGQSEMMGLPSSQLSDKVLIPIYFGNWGNYLNASLYFANADTFATTVDVKIAGVSQGTYDMQPNTSMVVRYTLDGGPVEISSNNGAKVVASLNQWRRPSPSSGWTGVAQSMALPVSQISDSYVIPRYNGMDATLYNAVLMANVDNVPRTITVKIGSTIMGSYLLGPSDSRFEVYNVTGGPLVVSSVAGSKIVASLYELKRAGAAGEYNGQSEMMGLPSSLLSDKYLIPIYFGNWGGYLQASLYIGVP